MLYLWDRLDWLNHKAGGRWSWICRKQTDAYIKSGKWKDDARRSNLR